MFCDTVGGAEASATIYSIVGSAQAKGLDIYKYLLFLLNHRPHKGMADAELEQLIPWSRNAVSVCRPDSSENLMWMIRFSISALSRNGDFYSGPAPKITRLPSITLCFSQRINDQNR